MEILLYLGILRRYWVLVAAVTTLAAIASLGAALLQAPRYGATARLLVTIGDVTRVDIEDPLAYDVAAIVHGRPFAEDVAAVLAAQGRVISADEVIGSLSATNQKRLVFLSAESSDPQLPAALLAAAIAQLRTGGLRYWGVNPILPERAGLSVVTLDLPEQAARLNGPAAIIREVALRTMAGLAIGALLAFATYTMTGQERPDAAN